MPASVTNNSDDEEGIEPAYKFDFTSFPTLADPEQDNGHTLSKMITTTLRKVTNNASTLVHNYSRISHDAVVDINDAALRPPLGLPSLHHQGQSMPQLKPAAAVTTIGATEASRIPTLDKSTAVPAPPLTTSTGTPTPQRPQAGVSGVHSTGAGADSGDQPPDTLTAPIVKSTSTELRLSMPTKPRLQPTPSTTNAIVNVNALVTTDPHVATSTRSVSAPVPVKPREATPQGGTGDLTLSLQNRISSIFNNLPNDIELSDDSASETETIYASPRNTPQLHRSRQHKSTPPNSIHETKSKPAGNLSSVFDNAKLIINTGINNVVSSSGTSIVSRKGKRQRKRKPLKKTSENPLKSGGIPKFYWMNDSFVSECLNCFKPFTAFRRKHHCRFCGQIFCNDCTLFISYSQHKEERRQEKLGNPKLLPRKKRYADRLRVCKPCYSDVIVYLSDDSSESSDSSLSENEQDSLTSAKSTTPVHHCHNERELHPISKVRSLSINSRPENDLADLKVLLANKGFLQESKPAAFTENSWSPSKLQRQPSKQNLQLPQSLLQPPLMAGSSAPDVRSQRNHSLHMAIPTTRTGETVEIPIPASSYSETITKNAAHNGINPSANGAVNSLLATPTSVAANLNSKPWLTSHHHVLGEEVSKSHSLDNLSHIYSNLMRKQSHFKAKTTGKPQPDTDDDAHNSSDPSLDDADFESETEDEQAMSLYALLNHQNGDRTTSSSIVPVSSALSPLATMNHMHPISPSANLLTITVPTLGEFPLMVADEKGTFVRQNHELESTTDLVFSRLFQSSYAANSENEKRVASFKEKPKSDSIRSHERAHASLLRMRSRRRSKSTRNVAFTKSPSHKNHASNSGSLRTSVGDNSAVRPSISPISAPTSPKPYQEFTPLDAQQTNADGGGYGLKFTNSSIGLQLTQSMSQQELMPETPIMRSTTGGELEGDSFLDESVQQYQPSGLKSLARIEPESLTYEGDESEDPNKVNAAIYQGYLRRLFRQYLEDAGLSEDRVSWTETISRLLSTVDQLKITDTLDTKQYIKIKRLLGGRIEDSYVVDGLFWTKNVDSKKMSSSIDNPKIALLMFPIEYLKQKEQFISLRIVHSQQDVYITNLVSRLISLEPDVIIVGDTVCGLAEKLLEDAKITVISNTKPQVIERISRYTKADIFQSVNDLFFRKGSLGTCKKLEVRKYLYKNLIKSFVFLTGSHLSSGFTISLRGGDAATLRMIKTATENIIPARLNANFEKGLFQDQFLIFRDGNEPGEIGGTLSVLAMIRSLYLEYNNDNLSSEGVESQRDSHSIKSAQEDNTVLREDAEITELLQHNHELAEQVGKFADRILTTSPAVKLPLPTTLANLCRSYHIISLFYYKHRQIQDAVTLEDLTRLDLVKDQVFSINIEPKDLPNKDLELLNILKFRSTIHLQSLKSNFASRLRLWTNAMNLIPLDPQRRNNIYVLNSIVSIKHATPCYGPVLVVTDNYTENDMCLGLFLRKLFSEASKVCTECGDSYSKHYRTYSHGNGKLDLVVEQIEDSVASAGHNDTSLSLTNFGNHAMDDSQNIFMWSYCTKCHSATPVASMSNDSYNLSIGKFFEMCFWGSGVTINSHECGHDFFKHHVRYFGLDNLAIKMVYSPIVTYEVVVPRKQLEYLPDIDIKLKLKSLELVRAKSQRFFSSISNRLIRVKVDTIDKVEDGLLKVEQLKSKLKEQVTQIELSTMEIYRTTPPSTHLPLNSILRSLQELGVNWDNEFHDFEKSFLPSENDITRITQFHLRRFLMDKYNDEEKTNDDTTQKETLDTETGKEELQNKNVSDIADYVLDTSSVGNKVAPNISNDAPPIHFGIPRSRSSSSTTSKASPELRREIGNMIPSSLLTVNNPQASVMEKIHKMEALLNQERKGSLSILKAPPLSRQHSMVQPKSPLKGLPLSHQLSDASLDSAIRRDSGGTLASMSGLTVKDPASKVHHLANFFDQLHFDQISAEFKKQREKELQKKLNRYKAFPVVASKPIVEIYDKIEDAVDEEKRDVTDTDKFKDGFQHDAHNKQPVETKNGQRRSADFSDPTVGPVNQNGLMRVKQELESELPQPEKNSLLKSLTNFWADRSATLWDPLEYPLGSFEHTFADSDVIVREDEPSSLIAFCLSSNDYKQKLQSMTDIKDPHDTTGDASNSTNPQNSVATPSSTNLQGSGDLGNNNNVTNGVTVISNTFNNKKAAQFAKIEKKFKSNELLPPSELEKIMNRFSTTHLKYQYLDGQTNLSCKIFYSEQFEAFRKACGNEDSFIQSLSRCVKWDSSGGKSGSSFLKTLDNRYILKELSKLELDSFVAIAPFYFKYMSQSMFNTLTTAIAKIFGFYQIHIRNPSTGKNFKMDFLIMENLFYNKNTTRIFDLKGSMRNRHVQQTGKANEVLLDENMVDYIYESPVFVGELSKKLLRGSLFNDTAFLSAMDVMDYSLVIGIVEPSDEVKVDLNKKLLYVGIIDCIRTFTWDKKVENWVKGTNLIGGKKGKDPTIITPKQYRTRFREAMERYILEVPDCWYNF